MRTKPAISQEQPREIWRIRREQPVTGDMRRVARAERVHERCSSRRCTIEMHNLPAVTCHTLSDTSTLARKSSSAFVRNTYDECLTRRSRNSRVRIESRGDAERRSH